ncbi:MAG: HAD family hydrolase [Gammaproteobacteria bacterium]|nr:HAD family hydrolase [Gammaproteobacteria bacterium]
MLEDRRFWIFDLDGTLTLAKHDFDEMRRALKLPPGGPILEALATLPESEAREKRRLLDEIEWEIATIAEPQPGAGELLGQLNRNGARLGILTRNTLANALHTLEACGLSQYFSTEDIVSRGCAAPKPSPDGIIKLVTRWACHCNQGVMVGDYLFDMQCGKAAGTTTVYFDPRNERLWNQHADLTVNSLAELAGLVV